MNELTRAPKIKLQHMGVTDLETNVYKRRLQRLEGVAERLFHHLMEHTDGSDVSARLACLRYKQLIDSWHIGEE